MKNIIAMIALALTGVSGSAAAEECRTGRLVGLDTRTQTIAGVSS